jgi:predicted DNA-binding protein with PD1-like motif
MDYAESRRTRHLLISSSRDDSLPDDLLLALEVAEVTWARLRGSGTLRSVELAVTTMNGEKRRTLQGRSELVSLEGGYARAAGQTRLEMWATIAFETDLGHEVVAGRLLGAIVERAEIMIVALSEAPGEPTAPGRGPAAPGTPRQPAPAPTQGTIPLPPSNPTAAPSEPQGPPVPPTRYRAAEDEVEDYPEPGDMVTHFLFGECTVVESDGERIRLRQGPDGRVREVALSMLRIQAPTTNPDTGKRHFELRRKN